MGISNVPEASSTRAAAQQSITRSHPPANGAVPALTGTIVYTDAQGKLTKILIPAGAIAAPAAITYTPIVSVGNIPSGFRYANRAFVLGEQRTGSLNLNPALLKAISLTIQYSAKDAQGLNAESLALYHWSDIWSSKGITVTNVDTANRRLSVVSRRLGKFALFGQLDQYNIYLPLVLK